MQWMTPAGFRPQGLPCAGAEEEPSGNDTMGTVFSALRLGAKLARAGSGSMLPSACRLSSHCREPSRYLRTQLSGAQRRPNGPCEVGNCPERTESREVIDDTVQPFTLDPATGHRLGSGPEEGTWDMGSACR